MSIMDKAMHSLKENKRIESEKLAKLVEKKLIEKVILTPEQIEAIKKEINSIVAYNQHEEISGNNMTEEEAIRFMEEALNDPYGEDGFFQADHLYEEIPDLDEKDVQDEVLRVAKEYFNSEYRVKEENKLTESGNYGGLINSAEDQLFGSITNTEVYERLQGIRDYLHDYEVEIRKNPGDYADDADEIAAAAFNIREALEALDKAWENQ